MRRRVLLAGALAACATPAFCAQSVAGRLATLDEDKIDIASAALELAKEVYPTADIRRHGSTVRSLADRAVLLCQGSSNPELRIRALNSILFRDEGFKYDRRNFSRSIESYHFLTGILETKLGTCVTLPLLYVAVAQKAGYPIYPVEVPDHNFARYRDPTFAEPNIECTNGGRYVPDDSYAKRFAVSEKGRASGAYLRTLTNREYLGFLIMANAESFWRRQRVKEGFDYMEIALRLYPRSALGHANMSEALLVLSKSPGQPADELVAKAARHQRRAQELGYVPQEMVPRSNSIRRDQ